MMIQFSANLGFLWSDRALPDAIRAAKRAGFDAVECHWPFDVPAAEVRAALNETGLSMLGLNTRRGNVDAGDNGLCAIPDRIEEARVAIDEVVAYAEQIGARNVHVMAGVSEGDLALDTFVANLKYACVQGAPHGLTILIEPLNSHDAPGYFLKNTAQAVKIIDVVASPNLKLMFDCYHVGRTEGDVIGTLNQVFPHIGHVQFASVPDRRTPDQGQVDYRKIFELIESLGWNKPLGAEYKPIGNTDATLSWLTTFR